MNRLRGDVAGFLYVLALYTKAVVTTVSCKNVLELSGALCCTRIGSPYVIAGVEALIAVGELSVVGFEHNRNFLLGAPLKTTEGVQSPLMTRGGVAHSVLAQCGRRLGCCSRYWPKACRHVIRRATPC